MYLDFCLSPSIRMYAPWGRDFPVFCSMYPQSLEQHLVHTKCSINAYWVSKRGGGES